MREFFPLPHVLKQIFSLVSQHYGLAFHLVEKPEQVNYGLSFHLVEKPEQVFIDKSMK